MPRRDDLGYTSHLAQSLDSKYIVEEVDMTETIPKIKKASASHGWSPTNIPMSWPRGLISWIMPQEKEEGGGQQGSQQSGQGGGGGGGGGGAGGSTGPIGLDHNQPKGPSGEGYMRGIGTNNHLATGAPSDPRDICILGDKKDDQSKTSGGGGGSSVGAAAAGGGGGSGGGEDNGGRPGDTVLYGREKETGPTQIHISNLKDDNFKPGCYITTRKDKNCLKFQLVDVQDDQGGGGGGGAGAQSLGAAATGGGGGGGGKSKGQRPLLKKESDTHITITKDSVTIKRGKGTVIVSDSKVIGFMGDEKKSFRVDGQHTHIRYGDNSIWVDSSGCWSSKIIQQKMCTDS